MHLDIYFHIRVNNAVCQDNDKINQVGRQGLLHRVHIKRHSKRTYLEWDFKWENCAQYFP